MRAIVLTGVLTAAFIATATTQSIPQDTGASGAWQKILKVRTTASVLHGTAHPDDEHGGVLAKLSRGDGARVILMTLTRGESGDNAIGSQLFDGLGLIRTDELLTADKYYGVDEQYFTTVLDYGFSKNLDETVKNWGLDPARRDVVRVFRMARPWVVISRFQGNTRDGHGNHQAAGLLSQQAAEAAADATKFPEQIAEGLRPWAPMKVYMGGVQAAENWTLRVDSGEYAPWLGDSFSNIAAQGLSFQRSQTSGRFNPLPGGPVYSYYTRTASRVTAPEKENSFFDGIDTKYAGLFKTLGRPAPAGVEATLGQIDEAVARAASTFTLQNPALAAPALADALRLTREVIARSGSEPDALFVLKIKERQLQDAVSASLGVLLTASATPTPATGSPTPGRGGGRGGAPTMTAPVPGQTIGVAVQIANRGTTAIQLASVDLRTSPGWSSPASASGTPVTLPTLNPALSLTGNFAVTISPDAPISTKPYFSRAAFTENRYTLSDPSSFGRPFNPAPVIGVGRYLFNGVPIEMTEVVTRREPNLPYGNVIRELRTVPRIALTVSPMTAVIPLSSPTKSVDLDGRRGGGDGRRQAVSRRVRADRASRSGGPVSLQAIGLESPRRRRAGRAESQSWIRDGHRRPGAARPAAARRHGDAARRARARQHGPRPVRRDHDRHARVPRPR
jgi:LmbE family N-acetylglucosaminyl deacetylase